MIIKACYALCFLNNMIVTFWYSYFLWNQVSILMKLSSTSLRCFFFERESSTKLQRKRKTVLRMQRRKFYKSPVVAKTQPVSLKGSYCKYCKKVNSTETQLLFSALLLAFRLLMLRKWKFFSCLSCITNKKVLTWYFWVYKWNNLLASVWKLFIRTWVVGVIV